MLEGGLHDMTAPRHVLCLLWFLLTFTTATNNCVSC